MIDFRALCAELMDAIDSGIPVERIKQSPLAVRVDALLAQPEPQGPSDEELRDLWSWAAEQDQGPWPTQQHCFARAVLARWGRPAIEPVPVGERLPGDDECRTNPRTGTGHWCWGFIQHDPYSFAGRWRMMKSEWLTDEADFWLPHWALPVPGVEGADA